MNMAALQKPQIIFDRLKHNPHHVVINTDEAVRIFKTLRKENISSEKVEPFIARAFLQAAFMACIDASYVMGFVEIIFRTFTVPVISSKNYGKVLKKLSVQVLKQYWRNAKNKDISNANIYEYTRKSVIWSVRIYFDNIKAGNLEDLL